jgi:hypothetical protein
MEDGAQRLRDLAVSDSGFVFDPYTGMTYNVNPTGRAIIEGIKDGLGRTALAERIEERFETGGRDVQRDLDEFLHLLRSSGLVTETFTVAP